VKRNFKIYFIASLVLGFVCFLIMLLFQLPLAAPTTEVIIGLEAFFILALLVEIFSIPLFSSQSTISVVPPVIWAMIVLFGPLYATIISVVSNFIYDFQIKKLKYQLILIRIAQYMITVSISGIMFLIMGGKIGNQELGPLLFPFIVSVTFYLFLDSLLSSCLIAFSEDISPYDAWVVNYRWMTPYELALVPFGVLMIFIYQQLSLIGLLLFLIPLLMIRRSYSLNIDLKRTYKETVQAFIRTIEAHDSYTSGHSLRVAKYSKQLAKCLKMPYQDMERLEIAAYLHDIGKIAGYFSEKILNNNKKLDANKEEKKSIHIYQSDRLISGITFLKEVGDIVRYHHERWDGTGYPEGLAGEQIPYSSRILMIADAFDAMTSDRPYRKAMSIQKAIVELQANAGSQFDAQLVQIFISECLEHSDQEPIIVPDKLQTPRNKLKSVGQSEPEEMV
jgi:putative nucleotidyltransferase with HDIG domain